MSTERAARLRALYESFNERDLEAVLAAMAPDVDWPNGWEGGRLLGRDEVRLTGSVSGGRSGPTMIVRNVADRPDGTVEARVRLVVRDPAGSVLERSEVTHVHEFEGPRVRRMTVEP